MKSIFTSLFVPILAFQAVHGFGTGSVSDLTLSPFATSGTAGRSRSPYCYVLSAPQSQGQSRGNRTPDEYVQLLESERRQSELQVAKVVETLKIKQGQRIADIGSGSGLFTRPLAKQTGAKGVVYAVDIDPELLKHVEKTAAEQKLTNIKTIMGAEDDPKLPEKVDLIVIIDTLHHIANQPTYLKGLKKYLKPNGRIALIDFSKTWPAGHEKMVYKVEDLDGWMKAAGYKQIERYGFLDNDFFVVYR